MQRIRSVIQAKDGGQFILINNALLHRIDESISNFITEKSLTITGTPSMFCLLIPMKNFSHLSMILIIFIIIILFWI